MARRLGRAPIFGGTVKAVNRRRLEPVPPAGSDWRLSGAEISFAYVS
jgi:hypothetical protein